MSRICADIVRDIGNNTLLILVHRSFRADQVTGNIPGRLGGAFVVVSTDTDDSLTNGQPMWFAVLESLFSRFNWVAVTTITSKRDVPSITFRVIKGEDSWNGKRVGNEIDLPVSLVFP